MEAFFVVDRDPVVSALPDLIRVFKEVSGGHFMPIRSVKALDKSVLARLAGVDITQLDTFALAPFSRYLTAYFRAAIRAYGLR